MNIYSEVKKDVFDFMKNQNLTDNEITEETDLYTDLNIYGDDVDEFFNKFAEQFKIDISHLDVTGCFPDEINSFSLFPKLTFRPIFRIKIKHLIDVVETGNWPPFENV